MNEAQAEALRDGADLARKRDRENGIPNPLVEQWKRENAATSDEARCTFSHGARCILRRGHAGGHYLTT